MLVTMKVEIVAGSKEKWEVDKGTGELKLDRVIEIPYPYNYGYIKGTLAEDNDQLDVFLIGTSDKLIPGSTIEVEVRNIIEMIDNDEVDHKIIAALPNTLIKFHETDKVKKFLMDYKTGVVVGRCLGPAAAEEYVKFCRERNK
jgi:inorganic pyrophosphatase